MYYSLSASFLSKNSMKENKFYSSFSFWVFLLQSLNYGFLIYPHNISFSLYYSYKKRKYSLTHRPTEDNFSSKTDPYRFHINSTSALRLVKRNKLSFSSFEINKPLLAPRQCFVDEISVQQPTLVVATNQMPDHILRVERSIISIDNNITDNILRKIINVQ